MKKHNFLSHILGLVERELEATLAILILLAGVVGYTLAGTETATQLVTDHLRIQAATSAFSIGTSAYPTISFDSKLIGTGIYRARNIIIPAGSPQNVINLANVGLTGGTATAEYTVKVNLASNYTGKAYVWSTGTVALNGVNVVNSATPVTVDASELTLTFLGNATIRAISTQAPASNVAPPVANLSVLPNTASMEINTTRSFIALATDSDGAAISNAPITWTVECVPSGIATINRSTGAVTATAAGKLTIFAKTDGNSASATVTVLAPVVETPAVLPGTPDQKTNNQTTSSTPPSDKFYQDVDSATVGTITPEKKSSEFVVDNQTLLDKIAEIIAGPANAATTNETASAPATSLATKTATALFAPEVITERVIATGNALPSKAEMTAVTKDMTLTQKLATNLSVSFKEMAFQIKSMVNGTTVTDRNGKVILNQLSLGQRIAKIVQGLTSGAGASPSKVSPEDDLPN